MRGRRGSRSLTRSPLGNPSAAVALGALVALAAAVRSLGFEWVLVDDRVVFPIADAQYHVRRALFGFHEFPRALLFDRYINYPEGAAVAWPPGWDWLLAAVGQLVPSEAAFERLLAWAPVAVGASTVVPVWLLARRLSGAPAAVAGGLFLALLPVHATFSRVGNIDHHVAVSCLGAWLLWCVVGIVEERDRFVARAAALALLRTALMLTWHGSLLYVAVVDGGLVLAVVATGCRRTAAAHAASALAGAVVLAGYAATTPEPLLGPFSSIALSWLHVLALLGVAAVEGALLLVATLRPQAPPLARLAAGAGAGVAFVALLLALPGPREGLEPALRFLTVSDAAGARTGEQFPLFDLFGREVRRPAWISWGAAAYTIPLVPLALLALGRRRPGVLVLAGWTAALGALAIGQRRYGNDLAPSIAVAWGLLAAFGAARLRERLALPGSAPTTVAAILVVALLLPGVLAVHGPKLRQGLSVRRGEWAGQSRMNATVAGSLTRFARAVRRHTPETAGFLDPTVQPEYGIVSHANLGHALQNVARRPTPTDPFWSYIGEEAWERAFGLLQAEDEATAIEHARVLRARYVVTTPVAGRSLEARLHFRDGSATAELPHLGHFRLVLEGPPGGRSANDLFQREIARARGDAPMPYKLFEIVPGAVVVVPGRPGEAVELSIDVQALAGRRFRWTARGVVGDAGAAEITVPYGRGSRHTTHTLRPYRVEVGGERFAVAVTDAQVAAGARVPCCGGRTRDAGPVPRATPLSAP